MRLTGCRGNGSSSSASSALSPPPPSTDGVIESLACQSFSYASVCPYDPTRTEPLRARYLSEDGRLVLLLADPWRSVWAVTSAAFGDAACQSNRFLALGTSSGEAPDMTAPALSLSATTGLAPPPPPSEPEGAGEKAPGGNDGGGIAWFGFNAATGRFDARDASVRVECA